jgi:hypothetical protein
VALVTDNPTPYKVHVVEQKKTLPPKDGRPAKMILKLGLEDPQGGKGFAEYFTDADPSSWPAEGDTTTLILTQPDNPQWALKARRPGRGGGGGRGRSPAETKRIERMACHKTAVQILGPIGDADEEEYLARFKAYTDWLAADLP